MGLPGPGGPPGPPGEDGDKVSSFHAHLETVNITGKILAFDHPMSLNAPWPFTLTVLTFINKCWQIFASLSTDSQARWRTSLAVTGGAKMTL